MISQIVSPGDSTVNDSRGKKKTFQEVRGHYYQEINTGKISLQEFSGTG